MLAFRLCLFVRSFVRLHSAAQRPGPCCVLASSRGPKERGERYVHGFRTVCHDVNTQTRPSWHDVIHTASVGMPGDLGRTKLRSSVPRPHSRSPTSCSSAIIIPYNNILPTRIPRHGSPANTVSPRDLQNGSRIARLQFVVNCRQERRVQQTAAEECGTWNRAHNRPGEVCRVTGTFKSSKSSSKSFSESLN